MTSRRLRGENASPRRQFARRSPGRNSVSKCLGTTRLRRRLASVLANEFTEATGDTYLSALVEIGLALFLVTIVVNALARLMVWSVTRGQPARNIA